MARAFSDALSGQKEIKIMITKDMTIAQVMEEVPDCAPVFMEYGMHCLGCAIAHGETVEQAAEVHGIDLAALLDALNALTDKA